VIGGCWRVIDHAAIGEALAAWIIAGAPPMDLSRLGSRLKKRTAGRWDPPSFAV
jgi:hypothetical protein